MIDYTDNTIQNQSPSKLARNLANLILGLPRISQEPLIRLLYKHGVSQRKIAKELGLTRQALSFYFPKEKGGEK